LTVKFTNEGHPEGNCERCGRYSKFLWTMGNVKTDSRHYICDKCHDYWKNFHIQKLMHMGDWNQLSTKEKDKFLDTELEIFLKKDREVVQFT